MREKRRDIGGILRRAIVDSHLIIGVLCFVLYDHSQGPAEQQSTQTPVHVAIGEPRIAENGDKRRGIRIVSEIQALSHLHVIVSQFLARGKVGNLVIDGRKEFVRIDNSIDGNNVSYLLGEESRSGILEFGRRSHVRKRESLAEIDLGDRHFWIKDQLLADVFHPAVVVIIEGCRGVSVYPLVIDLEKKKERT